MVIEITRFDGGLRVSPAAPYILDYLQYSRRSFEVVQYKRVNKYEKTLLYSVAEDGSIFTLHGFYDKLVKLIGKNKDEIALIDERTTLPEPDWDAVKKIGLRDYQVEIIVDFLQKAQDTSGILNCTGGTGKYMYTAG